MGSFQPWAKPDPQSVVGLNSQMVFGQNIQFAAGVNHQIAVGSNLQLCINPGTLFSMLGGPACSALSDFFGAGGLGGNMQFTIGTNTNVNWGQQYQVNFGGETITYDAKQQTAFSKRLAATIGVACIAYSIAFGACPDEDGRASIAIVFQVLVDVLLAVFMTWQKLVKDGNQAFTDTAKKLYKAASAEHPTTWKFAGIMATVGTTGTVGALLFPLIAVAVEENHFQGQTQSSS